jgi:hypothetical protein
MACAPMAPIIAAMTNATVNTNKMRLIGTSLPYSRAGLVSPALNQLTPPP